MRYVNKERGKLEYQVFPIGERNRMYQKRFERNDGGTDVGDVGENCEGSEIFFEGRNRDYMEF